MDGAMSSDGKLSNLNVNRTWLFSFCKCHNSGLGALVNFAPNLNIFYTRCGNL